MKICLLSDHLEFIPIIAKWYFDEWGYAYKEMTLDSECENLRRYLNTDRIPLMYIAINEGECVAAAQLKFQEMKTYPENTHWLGGVYVREDHRGKGIAGQVVNEIISTAKKLKVGELYLQTEQKDGGLYRHMGWMPIEEVHYEGLDVLVMAKQLN